MIYPVVSGTVRGPRINGTLLPVGADWNLHRRDGCSELDVQIVIETDDGALVYCYYRGISGTGSGAYVTPRFETSSEKYQWLTRIQAVGRGGGEKHGDGLKVTYSWYVLTE